MINQDFFLKVGESIPAYNDRIAKLRAAETSTQTPDVTYATKTPIEGQYTSTYQPAPPRSTGESIETYAQRLGGVTAPETSTPVSTDPNYQYAGTSQEVLNSASNAPVYSNAQGDLFHFLNGRYNRLNVSNPKYAWGSSTPKTSPETTPPAPAIGTSAQPRAEEEAIRIAKIKKQLEQGTTQPPLFKSAEEFKKLRTEQGVVKDEEELASLRQEALQGKEALRQFKATSSQGVSQAGYLGGVSEAERNLNFRIEGLAIREQGILDRINTKNSYIDAVIKFEGADYDTAFKNYEVEYNKNVKAIEIYNSQYNEQQKDALTGFTTLVNLLKDKNITTLDPSISTQMDTFALKLGMPPGLFQAAFQAMPKEELLAPVAVDNASGGKDLYFFTKNPVTNQVALKTMKNLPGMGIGGTSGGANAYIQAYNSAAFGLPEKTRTQGLGTLNSYLQQGNTEGAKEFLARTALQSAPIDVKNQILGANKAIANLSRISDLLDEYGRQGGNTNIIRGGIENLAQKLGASTNTNLAYIGNQIQQSFINYRRAMTGVAFSPQETAQYEKLFPNFKNLEGLNKAKIDSILTTMKSDLRTDLGFYMGEQNYDTIFGQTPASAFPGEQITPDQATKALDSIVGGQKVEEIGSWFDQFLNVFNLKSK